MDKRDYYEVLGVSRDADAKEIKSAFKKLAKEYHPDISKEADAEDKFKEIQEAYAVLSDDDKRRQYDQYGHNAFDQSGGFGGVDIGSVDLSDIFAEIFGGGFGSSMGGFGSNFGGFGGFGGSGQTTDPNAPRAGGDMELTVRLSFQESIYGTEKKIKIKREQDCHHCDGRGAVDSKDIEICPTCSGRGVVEEAQRSIFGTSMVQRVCPTCHGRGELIKNPCKVCHGSGRKVYEESVTVKFPAGVENGSHLRVTGKGEGGYHGGPNGDLYITVSVTEDKFYKRNGLDLKIEVPISYSQAVLGDKIDIPTVHGEVSLKIPAGTASGSVLRLKGKGIKSVKGIYGNNTGDQLVKVKVVIPKKITDKERKLLEELRPLEEKHVNQKGFFDKIKDLFK